MKESGANRNGLNELRGLDEPDEPHGLDEPDEPRGLDEISERGASSAFPADLVLPDGSLNGRWARGREILYRGMNGQAVERFYMDGPLSYIYKPLTNSGQWGQEKWVYEHVLPSFPPLYPQLLAASADRSTGLHWMIFEDMGKLRHEFSASAAAELARHVSWWHSQPVDRLVHIPLKGPKPPMEQMVAELLGNEAGVRKMLADISLPEDMQEHVYAALKRGLFPAERVLSHGDLHLGNYAQVSGRIVVLDWEHAHLNSPFWDLYHIIDMSHPSFPKSITSSARLLILQAYGERRGGGLKEPEFLREYALFACAFSLWMLGLIAGDLAAGGETKWPREQLERQLQETIASLRQCAEML
ncbi:aminoglycoside phosphotransferase family protein [Paenibacillus oenotherae]|uniref:Aminoglycoside phosphotransferase family protein n=1 Tax=Paenibacillus oenotherae TaxID=1435645 RepID=A0ABS7DCT2_9BACL|nr:phosphotransferase [Paenibacillus oenotherae]MBW7477645.1 aminoglycoside phosphotransferase family protein [Paenibacillus oenotherae]